MRKDGDDVAFFVEAHGKAPNLIFVRPKDDGLRWLFAGDGKQVRNDTGALDLGEDLLERDTEGLELLFFHPQEGSFRLCADDQPESALARLTDRFGHDADNIVKLTALQLRHFFLDYEPSTTPETGHL